MRLLLATVIILGSAASAAQAESVSVAVAANFTAVAEDLASQFEADTGNTVSLSFGSTGQLYTQISQGAPFDVFLSADDVRPTQAVEAGLAVANTVFTYAVGSLALYSPSIDLSDGTAVLKAGDFSHIAIADPETAPYGRAAIETLSALGLADTLVDKTVTGENITQTLQFVDTGNAEIGFVAASQVVGKDGVWIVPANLHEPIEQDAVLLKHGADSQAAKDFVDFLQSDAARQTIEAAGYTVN